MSRSSQLAGERRYSFLLLKCTVFIFAASLLGLSTFTPRFIQLRSLKRHLDMISEDDALLLNEHHGSHLTPSEVRQALLERGM